MEGIKILHTPVRFYPYVGGVENYVYSLSRYLVNFGHEVTVLCANVPKNKKTESINGVKVKRLGYIGRIANTHITPCLPIKLMKENFDVIHTHLPTPWSADWSSIFAKLKNKPLVLTYHNDIVSNGFASYIAKVYNLTALKLVLGTSKRIVITQPNYLDRSPYLKRYKDKIEIVPVGVDVEKFRPLDIEEDENTLFFLSVLDEFHEYKGLEYLLKALKIVKEEIKDVRLIVGGDGVLRSYYQRMAHSLNLRENVEFVGFIPDDKLVEYYNRCAAFVLPSYSSKQEGFGIVLLEALACEKPVITTEIVGVSRDVEKYNVGKIVRPQDLQSLANAIIEVLQDKDLRREMGRNGRKVAEKYSWETIARAVEKIYLQSIENGSKGRA